jgi:hypothetical protein
MARFGTKSFIVIAAMIFALLADTELANAKVVRWKLQHVQFDDGGAATGFFLVDPNATWSPSGWSTNPLVGWDLTVQPGPPAGQILPPGYRFSSASEPFGTTSPEKNVVVVYSHAFLNIDPVGRTALQLQLFFDRPLSDLAPSAAITGGFENYTYFYDGARYITAGEIVAVPEPAAALLLSFGLAALGVRPLRRSLRH